jgi:hypothetical protein
MTEMVEQAGKNDQNLIKNRNTPGIVLYKRIKSGEIDPEGFTPIMRRMVVRVMRYQFGVTTGEIAEKLACSEITIRRDLKKIQQENFDHFTGLEIQRELSEVLTWAEHYALLEARKGNYKEAWKIRREKIDLLQSLGFLPKDLGTLKIEGSLEQKQEMDVIDLDNLTEDQQAKIDIHWNEILKVIGNQRLPEEPKALNP